MIKVYCLSDIFFHNSINIPRVLPCHLVYNDYQVENMFEIQDWNLVFIWTVLLYQKYKIWIKTLGVYKPS